MQGVIVVLNDELDTSDAMCRRENGTSGGESTKPNNRFSRVVVVVYSRSTKTTCRRRRRRPAFSCPPRRSRQRLRCLWTMDGFSLPSQVQVMPRLRITRQSFTMSGAGSSQPSARPGDHVGTLADLGTTYALEDDEDDESTPRRAPTNTLHPLDDVDTGDKSEATPIAETPANRLRALLSRSPGSATPTQRYRSTSATSSKAPTGSGSPGFNFDSSKPLDLTTPKHPFSPPFDEPPMSVARENLRSLFVHALRDPGDTPVKNGQRRRSNSIGSSAVDGTPVKARAHAKRLNLSDEEADHMSSAYIFLHLAIYG